MIVDAPKELRKAPYFFVVSITKEEIIKHGENEGRKIIIDVGNQIDESYGNSAVDFMTDQNYDWIDPKNRIKITLCEDATRDLVDMLEQALTEIKLLK